MRVTFVVNGDSRAVDVEPCRTLADALREDGVQLGCTDGTCGGCTVLVDGEAVRSCLMLAVQCEGTHVRTVEGLAVDHPLQAVRSAASGRCVAGLVMLAAGALDREPELAGDPERMRRLLSANVCRCAGHEAIKQAVAAAAQVSSSASPTTMPSGPRT